jgi:ATP/maltotriose-dependent transcriptional regulator MalT
MQEIERARDHLARRGERAVGLAHYQQGEILRLRGDYAAAEECYRLASQWGRKPHPGLSLLRLAQGQIDAAKTSIARVLEEAKTPRSRSQVLAAYVEIMLAAGDMRSARAGADELTQIAESFESRYLHAFAARAEGAVRLAEGDAREALEALRGAALLWEDFEAPYEAAHTTLLIAQAYRGLGDFDSAELELDVTQRAFESLGALPAAQRVADLRAKPASPSFGTLTGREVEVLRLVAAGKTNRSIAHELGISEKTIARHISNIFTKLDLSSRAAATAYAYKKGLV